MIAIVDYGVGNLFSLRSSLSAVGAEVTVTGDGDALRRADKIILPGVGAFGDAAAKLRATGLDAVVIEEAKAGKPLLGICLGMQLLLERSLEYGEHAGLGLIPGDVVPLSPPDGLKVPHMGWNALQFSEPRSPIFRDLSPGDHVYFVHSFHAANCPCVTATAEYGVTVTAAVGKDNVYGCQFHPEKSGPVGLSILKSFCEL
mgnify:FL=1